ncbi:MAG: hypothetical protein WC867_08665 [Candidatus Pacearchaeota archaeon]|jgi:hypothetical protein
MLISKKDRRHSGRRTYFINDNDYPYLETKWDDWRDYRDSFRGNNDRTLIKKSALGYGRINKEPKIDKNNKKLKRYYKIRKTRKRLNEILLNLC